MVFETDLDSIKTETDKQAGSVDYQKIISDIDSLIAKVDSQINDPLEKGETILDWLQNEKDPNIKDWKLTKLSLQHAKAHAETIVRDNFTQLQHDRITRALTAGIIRI